MKRTCAYLLLWLVLIVIALSFRIEILALVGFPTSSVAVEVFLCSLLGATGTVLYCIRGVYEACSVRSDWHDRWLVWYFLRPFAGLIVGGTLYVFMRAGLVVLSGDAAKPTGNLYLFLSVAFLAGLNVKNFVTLLEATGHKNFGLQPSRATMGARKEDAKAE